MEKLNELSDLCIINLFLKSEMEKLKRLNVIFEGYTLHLFFFCGKLEYKIYDKGLNLVLENSKNVQSREVQIENGEELTILL